MIIGVAVRINAGEPYFMSKPFRHNHLLKCLFESGIEEHVAIDEQGFITNTGEYLNRKYAEYHARTTGQLKKKLIGSVLTSEDLW